MKGIHQPPLAAWIRFSACLLPLARRIVDHYAILVQSRDRLTAPPVHGHSLISYFVPFGHFSLDYLPIQKIFRDRANKFRPIGVEFDRHAKGWPPAYDLRVEYMISNPLLSRHRESTSYRARFNTRVKRMPCLF